MTDFERVKDLLRRPRDLTTEEWQEAARIVQEGSRRRAFSYRDEADVSDAYGYDRKTGAYFVEANTGPGGMAYTSSATNTPSPGRP